MGSNDMKCKYMFMFPLKNLARKELNVVSIYSTFSSLRWHTYRKTFSVSPTKSQSLNVSCFFLQLSLLNLLKQGIKLRMKM